MLLGCVQVLASMCRKGSSRAQLMGLQVGAAAVENSVDVPPLVKMGIPCGPEISLLGVDSKKSKKIHALLYSLQHCLQ